MNKKNTFTLKQIQQRLNVPQHILIHLCEKEVITPDIKQTKGRGQRREFSPQNLLEFAISLSMRNFGIPISQIAVIIRLLKSFEKATRRLLKDFSLIRFLLGSDGKIKLYLYDGTYLVFNTQAKDQNVDMFRALDISKIINNPEKPVRVDKLDSLPLEFETYLCIDLHQIIKRIF